MLKFAVAPPWSRAHKAIYVRAAYDGILEILRKKPQQNFLIVGNPGTGKSLFAVYVLYCALQDSKPVVFHVAVENKIYLFQADKKARWAKETCMAEELQQEGMLHLYDAATRHRPAVSYGQARLIAFSSPSRENISDFVKRGLNSLCMPTWSKEELLHASKLDQYKRYIDEPTVESLFDMFGGIARYVLEVNEQQRRANCETLDAKISLCSMQVLRASKGAVVDTDSHMIIHRNVRGMKYNEYELEFASPYVGKKVVDSLQCKAFEDMKAFVKCETLGSATSSLRGWLLEPIVHTYLPKGKPYMVRKLSDGSQTVKSFPKCTEIVFDSKVDDLELPSTSSVYLRPESKTFESADALCPPDCIFQITVSARHSIKANGLKKILKKFEEHEDWKSSTRINYYFVVPEDVYKSFIHEQEYVTKSGSAVADTKPFDHVDQYVVKFDF